MDALALDQLLKPILLKDLRIQCRARGLSPAGGKEQLTDRLREDMIATGNYCLKNEAGEDITATNATAGLGTDDVAGGGAKNNYTRPDGQNVGNFLTDRPSSRVLAAPGGGSSIVFGDGSGPAEKQMSRRAPGQFVPSSTAGQLMSQNATNNYARPAGQNVGNFLTDRHTVKVAAPPGGQSQITFG